LADHIEELIAGQRATVSDVMSLGTRWDVFSSSASKDIATQQRRALRSLLLCQRVYFSDLWPGLIGLVAQRVPYNWLPANWKEQSLTFWGGRTESDIRAALRMFIATSDASDHAANAAVRGQPSAPLLPFLTATRDTFGGQQTATCYDAVMLWLFKSGLVSLRWLLRHRNANTQATLDDAFGAGTVIWNGAFAATDHLASVPRGHIVHIFEDAGNAWRGHWMISTGKGGAAGCNNNTEGTLPRHYCNTLTLDGQFRDFGQGTAIVINPQQIPGRL
jgi:hypothetical protein